MNISDVAEAEDDDFGEEVEEVLCTELEIVLEEGEYRRLLMKRMKTMEHLCYKLRLRRHLRRP